MVPNETRAGQGCPHCHLIIAEAEFTSHCRSCNPVPSQSLQSLQSESSDFIVAQFSCKYCAKKYRYRVNCIRHEKTHLGLKPHVCNICSKAFHRKDYLKNHLRTHEKAVHESMGECPNCHCMVTEAEFVSHRCTPNPLLISQEDPLLKPSNSSGGLFSCRYCDKKYGARENCKRHERTHFGIKPHVCNICSKSFFRKDYLKNHLKTHFRPSGARK